MASGHLSEWDWLAPENDKDWNAEKLAYRIFYGALDEEEEAHLERDGFWFQEIIYNTLIGEPFSRASRTA